MAAPSGTIVVPAAELAGFAGALLQAAGLSGPHAAETADMLVWANARGIESHGVLRLPRYVEMMRLGMINPQAAPRIAATRGAAALLDGDRAPGAVAMTMAAGIAVRLAKEHAIGWCSARDISHAGAIGWYAERIAREGCIGIVMTASKPLMTYHGTQGESVSTNPIAISVPTEDEPVTLDMSTAAVALGKIMAAKDAGRTIPEGWGVDAAGRPTTDPAGVKALLPMAGPKGSGLALMIEVLCSVLARNPIVSRALAGESDPGFNGAALALDVSGFGPPERFRSLAAELFRAIKGLPPASGTAEVFLPGERSARVARDRMASGIPLVRGTADRLAALAAELGIAVPRALGHDDTGGRS